MEGFLHLRLDSVMWNGSQVRSEILGGSRKFESAEISVDIPGLYWENDEPRALEG